MITLPNENLQPSKHFLVMYTVTHSYVHIIITHSYPHVTYMALRLWVCIAYSFEVNTPTRYIHSYVMVAIKLLNESHLRTMSTYLFNQ